MFSPAVYQLYKTPKFSSELFNFHKQKLHCFANEFRIPVWSSLNLQDLDKFHFTLQSFLLLLSERLHKYLFSLRAVPYYSFLSYPISTYLQSWGQFCLSLCANNILLAPFDQLDKRFEYARLFSPYRRTASSPRITLFSSQGLFTPSIP